jgi:cysteine desulfurase/selenocysteine lyase
MGTGTEKRSFDVTAVRAEFPALAQMVHGKRLAYLDNAATTQKPRQVIEAVTRYYERDNANVHRGVHLLSERATSAYEQARDKVRWFINAAEPREIVFVRGATEGVNLVAQTWGRRNLRPGDEVLISTMEHHSNIVPWQMVCQDTGAVLRVIPMDDRGELLMDEYSRLLNERTRLVSVVHVSNALGTINPVKEIVSRAHERGVPVLLDGAQAVSHLKVDVRDLGCDFYVLSGHKMFGPTGIGALYGRASLLDEMPPYQGGGDMIRSVSFEGTTYNSLPYKFEAGTPNIGGAVGLGAAIDYLTGLGLAGAAAHEHRLLEYATERLSALPGLRIVGTARQKAGVLSFVVDGVHPHDIGTILDTEGVAIRAGHHCCQPLMQRLGLEATARASLAFYNTTDDIDALVAALARVGEVFL